MCLSFCQRPGWWSVAQAAKAVSAGYAERMMLELSPEETFGVLSPAFKGAEGGFATQEAANSGCTFLTNDRCELHGTQHSPIECRFCHHDRPGLGPVCHADLEADWRTPAGFELVARWARLTNFWERQKQAGQAGQAGLVP